MNLVTLATLRKAIDRLDARIVELLNQRAQLSQQISLHKKRSHLPVFAPDRERQLLQRLEQLQAQGSLPLPALKAIYREIISASLALQGRMHIAYFGPEAAFTHQAAVERFGSSATYQPVRTIADVFREVESGRADYGVVPVENSTEGTVNHTLDMFTESEVKICSELFLRIEQNLLSRETSLQRVKKIYTHVQVPGQCRVWLEGNLPEVPVVEVSSTSKAAQMASEQPGTAAIASRLAARRYQVHILAKGIQDSQDNFTRFLVLGQTLNQPTGQDKTSVMLAIKDSVGALFHILQPFARNRVNLTSIESRPSRVRAWNYVFFIDCLGHANDPKVKRALAELRPMTQTLQILGSYPRGEQA